MTVLAGLPGFFRPDTAAFLGLPLTPKTAAYRSAAPLEATPGELTDVEVLNACATRLTVGAASLRTAEMRYFDSRDTSLTIRHILASGALPPAFPAVRIGGELHWDGGILSSTPVEAVLDDDPRRGGLVFTVNIWQPHGPEPHDIPGVLGRQKDLQYASRANSQVARRKQIHRLRHVIAELARKLPPRLRESAEVRRLSACRRATRRAARRCWAACCWAWAPASIAAASSARSRAWAPGNGPTSPRRWASTPAASAPCGCSGCRRCRRRWRGARRCCRRRPGWRCRSSASWPGG
jgi:predicted acylesterase/phospholipase RssA